MKKISLLIISALILMYNCEKSETIPDNPDPNELNNLYDTVKLNNLYIMFNGDDNPWVIDTFSATINNSKFYLKVITDYNFDADVEFIITDFSIDSFLFKKNSGNITNLRYPAFNDLFMVEDNFASTFTGEFASGYMNIDIIDTDNKVVCGNFEFQGIDNQSADSVWKLKKSYFKINYFEEEYIPNNNSAHLQINSEDKIIRDIYTINYFPIVHTYIVTSENNAVAIAINEDIHEGENILPTGYYGYYLPNIDLPYLGPYVEYCDSGKINLQLHDIESSRIKASYEFFIKETIYSGDFDVYYLE